MIRQEGDQWRIKWKNESPDDTLKLSQEIKPTNEKWTEWDKTAASNWRKTQKEQKLSATNIRRIPVLLAALNTVLFPLRSAARWVIGTFRTEILKPNVMRFKCHQYFGEPSRKVKWSVNSMEYHVPTRDDRKWAIMHVTLAGRGEVGTGQNDKMQKWGVHFKTGQEASFFLKSATKVRLEKGQTKSIKIRVCDARDGRSSIEEVDVCYDDVVMYLQDFRWSGIHYLKEIADRTYEHTVNVWVCGETVVYLPPPVMTLDPLHSVTIAKTFGKRWEKENGDTNKKRKRGPSSQRSRGVARAGINKRTKPSSS